MARRKTLRGKKKKLYRKSNAIRTVNMQGRPSGFPLSQRAYLRYSDKISLASSLGSLVNHVFRCNSGYDPDFTGIGHQPMGWDQWSMFYNHYVVSGARINIEALGTSATSAHASVLGVYLNDSSTGAYTDFYPFVEAKRGAWIPLTYQRNRQSITANYSTKKFFNIVDVKDNVDRLGAGVGASPTEEAYFNIFYQDLDAGSTGVELIITIDYIIDFSEPKDIPIST